MSNQKREDVRLSDFLFWHLVAAILIIETGQVDGKSIGGKTMIHSQPCWDWGAGYKAQKSMKTIINMVLISIYGVKSIVTHKSFALFLYRKTFLLKKKIICVYYHFPSLVYPLKKCHTYRHYIHMFHRHFIINPSGYILENILFYSLLSLRQCHVHITTNRIAKQEWNSNISLDTKSFNSSLPVFLTFVLSSLYSSTLSQNRILVTSCLRHFYHSF